MTERPSNIVFDLALQHSHINSTQTLLYHMRKAMSVKHQHHNCRICNLDPRGDEHQVVTNTDFADVKLFVQKGIRFLG